MSGAEYMLDTNILSNVLRNARGRPAAMLKNLGFDRVCTSAVVASEMRFGAVRKGSSRLVDEVEQILNWVPVLSYDDAQSSTYAEIRALLERRGAPIGAVDLFIAAHARSLDLTLVTDNIREFSRIDGLKLENWIDREESHVE